MYIVTKEFTVVRLKVFNPSLYDVKYFGLLLKCLEILKTTKTSVLDHP